MSLFLCVIREYSNYIYIYIYSCPVFSGLFIKDYHFLIVYCWILCCNEHRYVGLSLDFLSSSTDLDFCFWASIIVFDFWSFVVYSLKSEALFFQFYFSFPGLFWLFRVFCVSIKTISFFLVVLVQLLSHDQRSAFLMAQLSHVYMTTGKTIALTR